MRYLLGTLVVVATMSPAPASAAGWAPKTEAPKPKPPSPSFTKRSLDALTAMPTVSAARWQDLLARHPQAVLTAIADAERLGWKPTSTTFLAGGRRPRAGVKPASLQDLYATSSVGEIIVWDWDDGNPATVEGTVSALSYVTGNYVTFNLQLAGDWAAPVITYYAPSAAEMTPTGFVQAPASVWGSPQHFGFRRVQ